MLKIKGKKLTESTKKERSKLTPVDFEIPRKLQEGIAVGGVDSAEDYGWRSLTAQVQRDLTPLAQKRMQEISFFLYDSNPMAHRIIEMGKEFIIGDGFRYMAKDPRVQDVLDDFWNDPDNNWNIKQDKKVLELSLWGEQCYPVYINPHNGHVKLGYLDPGLITDVRLDPSNPERIKEVHWSKRSKVIKWKVINNDNRISSKTRDKLIGDCFYFSINNVSFSSRGRGDLLTLADWIDGYDQFLFARLERAFFLNNYIWDILCEGMNKKEIEEFAKGMKPPAPGSARVHNEKITYSTVETKLESADASAEAGLFKNQILSGAGYPGHWFGEGEKTTRATAQEMGLPTLKKLKSRQKYVKYMLQYIFSFVIDQKIIHGMLPKDIDKKFVVMPSPIITKDARGLAITVDKFANAMTVAVAQTWISEDTARTAFRTFMTDLGIELHELEELAEYAQAYKKAKGGKDEKDKDAGKNKDAGKPKDEDESKPGSK